MFDQPFLVSLGLPKSLTALIWIAGPFCGAFVQPVVGYLSDMSRPAWGQRRPIIVIGAVSTILSLWMLAWTESGTKWLVHACRLEVRKEVMANIVIAFAIFWIYALNVSIQPLQVGLRALVVENCPTHQQAQASAWASLMTGGGNIFGYLVGFTPLPEIAKQLCLTQFQWLCIVASLALAIMALITCCFIHERSSEALLLPPVRGLGQLLRTFRTTPPKIRRVFQIQIFAWMAWFPYLFYATT
jgi:solute carrier family 45 protein 1/2/4